MPLLIVLLTVWQALTGPVRCDELSPIYHAGQLPVGGPGVFRLRIAAQAIRPDAEGPRIEARDISLEMDGRSLFPIRGPLFDGRVTLQSGALVFENVRFDDVRIDFNGQLKRSASIELAGDLVLSFSRQPFPGIRGGVKKFSFRRIAARLRWDERILRIGGDLRLPGSVPVHFELTHRSDSGNGKLVFDTGPAAPDRIRAGLEAIIERWSEKWPAALALVSGQVSFHGTLRWPGGKKARPLTVSTKMSDIGGSYGKILFSGLGARFHATVGDRIRVRASEVSLPVIDVGVPITDLRSAVTVTIDKDRAPVIVLENLFARVLGGHVSEPRIRLDLGHETNRFDLRFEQIDVTELVAIHRLDGLQADGRLSGNLPIELGPAGARIRNGRIGAIEPGGRIQYRPEDGGRALAGAGKQMELLLGVLEDFHYHTLNAAVGYASDGALEIHMAFEGRGVEGDVTRPVHFNLRVEQNVSSLLKSLRIADGINERLDESVRRHFQGR